MQPKDISSITRQPGVLATHTVLRNTYFLLSLSLLFSAAMAYIALSTNAPPLGPIVTLVGMFGLLFLTQWLRNSAWGLLGVFAFTGFIGYTLGPTLNMMITNFSNGTEIIMTAVGATGIIFFALSAYVLTTRKDFSYMGGFLFVALVGAILLGLAGLLFNVPGIWLLHSAIIILVASGLILFDTSRIIHNGETNYISATIQLYLDLLMLFVNLLQILGALGGNRN